MEIVNNPLGLIDQLYEQAGCPRTSEGGDWGVGEHFSRFLDDGLPVRQLKLRLLLVGVTPVAAISDLLNYAGPNARQLYY